MAENKITICPCCGKLTKEGDSVEEALNKGRVKFENCAVCSTIGEHPVLDDRLMGLWSALHILAGNNSPLLAAAVQLRMLQYMSYIGEILATTSAAFIEAATNTGKDQTNEGKRDVQDKHLHEEQTPHRGGGSTK